MIVSSGAPASASRPNRRGVANEYKQRHRQGDHQQDGSQDRRSQVNPSPTDQPGTDGGQHHAAEADTGEGDAHRPRPAGHEPSRHERIDGNGAREAESHRLAGVGQVEMPRFGDQHERRHRSPT